MDSYSLLTLEEDGQGATSAWPASAQQSDVTNALYWRYSDGHLEFKGPAAEHEWARGARMTYEGEEMRVDDPGDPKGYIVRVRYPINEPLPPLVRNGH